MKIARRFTRTGQNVFDSLEWTRRSSRIANSDGSTVFEMKDAEVPASWSQLATDIVVSKYFRKAGVPQTPQAEAPADASDKPALKPNLGGELGGETSVRQIVHRLAGCWQHWGERFGYFSSKRDAEAFYDELSFMLLNQYAAPNSPQWFNTGLNYAYGISGPAQGHWIADHATGAVSLAHDAYTHPQPHACFIQAVRDDLVGEGGIMDLWTREARLFKYGSGTGTNFSALRGENEALSGGGKSSGLMSFLKIGDRAAGAIKSGGTTRRAAKMVCLDIDHPDVESFINWKVREELKVAALVEGMKHLDDRQRAIATRLGLKLDYDFNGEAYFTVSGQNSNNSVRLSDAFMDAVESDSDWTLLRRTDGKSAKKLQARELWRQVTDAAWHCADPGVQFDSTINAWHTCPAGGRINASNPCSEYMFLDNTACNLASINLLKFYDASTRTFDIAGYEHAIGLWTIVLEISVLMASFPSKEIAELSWKYRTLGLGYANLGAMLMQAGIPYDSDAGRAVCGALSAILTGRSYATSALLAAEHGPFAGFEANREPMLRVMRNHRRAALGLDRASDDWEDLRTRPVPIDHSLFTDQTRSDRSVNLGNATEVLRHAIAAWDDAVSFGEKFGYRNAQTTVIAPTGTIGLLMDCDTTGVEPDFALTKFKKLAGGGYFKIANQSLRPALHALGYAANQVDEILVYVMGSLSLDVPMPTATGGKSDQKPQLESQLFRDWLASKGFTGEELVAVENQLPTIFELRFAFTAWSIPERILLALGIDPEAARKNAKFNGLRELGLSRQQIDALNLGICGTQTIEGAPHLRDEHLAVFDCANRCGELGQRFIAPEGHIRMMAAAQPFISGAISKTINLPNEASVADIGACYTTSWALGLKANALYRDGSKLSQPLSTKSDAEDSVADDLGDMADDDEVLAAAVEAKRSAAAELAAAIASATSAADPSVSRPSASSPSASGPSASGPSASGEAAISSNECELTPTAISASAPTEVAPIPIEHPTYVERIVERVIERPMRRRLPDTRESITHKFNVAGHEGYLIVGLYEDGRPGELFITMAKEGSTIGGLMDSLGTAISVALQYGVPIESLVNKFAHQRFEPMGMTTNRDIPFAKSLVDYIFRWLGMQFIAGYREANAPHREGAREAPRESSRDLARAHLGTTPAQEDPKEDHAWNARAADPPSANSMANPSGQLSARLSNSRDGLEDPSSGLGSGLGSGSGGGSSELSRASRGGSSSPFTNVPANALRASGAMSPSPSDRVGWDGMGNRATGGSSAMPAISGSQSAERSSPTPARNPQRSTTSPSVQRASARDVDEVASSSTSPSASEDGTCVESSGSVTIVATTVATTITDTRTSMFSMSSLDQTNVANASLMGDAPACDSCGAITVRNGTCYRCLNCGNSMGCS